MAISTLCLDTATCMQNKSSVAVIMEDGPGWVE